MLGMIATIIAAVKGRTGFAWFTGIWTVLAFIIAFSGGTQYAVAPGGLFLIIAICMKKEGADSPVKSESAPANDVLLVSDPSKKYICKACGNYSTGWYQTCPNCGAIGKMEKVSATMLPCDNTPSTESSSETKSLAVELESDNLSTPSIDSIMFCRECGTRLIPGAAFCPECGKRMIDGDETPISSESNSSLALSISPSDEKEDEEPEASPSLISSVALTGKGLSPILRRAFILIEDENWAKADDYLERILDEEPENAYAYLGKLLIEKNCSTMDKLFVSRNDISSSCNYVKALRYAEDEDLKAFLRQFE